MAAISLPDNHHSIDPQAAAIIISLLGYHSARNSKQAAISPHARPHSKLTSSNSNCSKLLQHILDKQNTTST
jgi:hypothetical protein